jgi:Lysozyme like domain
MRETKVWLGIMLLVVTSAVFSNNANASTKNNLLKQTMLQKSATAHKAVFFVSKAEMLKKYKNKPVLSDRDLALMLKAVGFKGQDLKEAWAIAKKESNGQPIKFNGNTKTGDSSYGLFQINMIRDLGPERRDKFNLDTNFDLLNPVTNAQVAYHMSNGGKNWSAWNGITAKTKMWLKKFPHNI